MRVAETLQAVQQTRIQNDISISGAGGRLKRVPVAACQ